MKLILYILLFTILTGCASGVFTVESINIENYLCNAKQFEISDFNIYVFNVCEKYDKQTKSIDRFCDCPDNFFDISKDKKLKKVEEVYLLVDTKSNLVLYFTTFSHKYIRENQTGFLNDARIYNNKLVLDQTDKVYVGKIDKVNKYIVFNKLDEGKSIALHYTISNNSDTIQIISVNIPTVEHHFKNNNEIALYNVFSREIEFVKNDYSITYYKNISYLNKLKNTNTILPKTVESIYFKNENNELSIIFQPKNKNEDLYKFTSKKIPYQPFFFEIQN